ncbi:MAG TPA: ATP-binding protein [Blastocatellia bacterium]|nr:ATP-binding protein [Blastocatellia bacterium]
MTSGHLLLITTAATANLGLGIAIVSRNRRSPIHRYFGFFSFSVASWTLSNGLVSAYPGTEWGYIWGRLAFASASLIPIAFLFFASVFPTAHPTPPPQVLSVFVVAATGALIASLTPLIVKGTTSVNGALQVQYGPLHLPFGVYFISCLSFSLFLLTRKLMILTGLQKLQVRYLFAGVLTAALGATIASLIIPLVFGTSQFSRYGPLFGILMIAIIAHAVIRYRLMDIKIVIRKGVVYVCAIIAAAAVFILIAEILKRLAGYEKDSIPILEAVIVALTLAIFFQPLKNSIQRSFNRYVYRETYDYQRTIREASRRLSAILDLDPLLDYLTSIVEDTFKAETVIVYLKDHSGQTFSAWIPKVRNEWPDGSSRPSIKDKSAFATFLKSTRRTLVREEAIRDVQDKGLTEVVKELAELGGEIAFPLIDDQTVVAIIVVGAKRSGDPYFTEDIDLLETLISQAAVAMKNAQLYRQVVLVNEYVDNILSTMESGVIAVNAAGEISLFNPAAERLTGFRASSVHGSSYRRLPAALASPLQDALDVSAPRSQFETSIQLPDGTNVPLVCSTAILKYRGSFTHGALIVFSDLTRLKDLEREKRRAERLASFGALASGVAHEIKNPLVAIRTFAELLPDRFTDSDFRDDFAKVVIREIARIDDLVGRLRGIAATSPQQVGVVDIREPIKETLVLLRAQLEQTRTIVHCDFLDSAPFVAIEEAQLKQLFLNLLLNAIEAMGPGGQVTIQVHRKDLHGSQCVIAEVADTGPGIPESVKTNIFDPFFTTKPRGSGLGLAICRGITDAHRGTIRAESRPDRSGTVFIVEFPASLESAVFAEENVLRN